MERMEKQLTAVNWLVSQLNKKGFAQVITDEEIEQAKEMEKVQIMETYYQALCDRFEHNLIPISFTRKEEVERFGIPYYEKTFKSE
jgi:predicted GNAT family acetyltransferase